MKMKIEFEKIDAEKILYDSFCNGGLSELYYASVGIEWESEPNSTNYSNAKKRLQDGGMTSICIEDVYIEILKNGDVIQFTDYEGEELINLNLEDALVNFNSLEDSEKIKLAKLLDDDDCSTDAWDCFNAIQYALYGEVIYG
jgi:hypothetical protein